MSPALSVLFVFGTIVVGLGLGGVSFRRSRRRKLAEAERSTKDLLIPILDAVIAKLAEPKDEELRRVELSERIGYDGDRRRHVSVDAASGDSVKITMAARKDGWSYDANASAGTLTISMFPPIGAAACASPWFIERMERLVALAERYPQERTGSYRIHAIMARLDRESLEDMPDPETEH